jgi:hypothetical protein
MVRAVRAAKRAQQRAQFAALVSAREALLRANLLRHIFQTVGFDPLVGERLDDSH